VKIHLKFPLLRRGFLSKMGGEEAWRYVKMEEPPQQTGENLDGNLRYQNINILI